MKADLHQYYSKPRDHQSFRTQTRGFYLSCGRGYNLLQLQLWLLKQNQGLKTVLNKFCSKRNIFLELRNYKTNFTLSLK